MGPLAVACLPATAHALEPVSPGSGARPPAGLASGKRGEEAAASASASAPEPTPEPFSWGDFTWLNGGSRQTSRVLETPVITGQVDIDLNYSFSFHRPIDDTVVGSTELARHNELQLAFLGFGGDLHWGATRGRIFVQMGTRSTVVPRNDASVLRGQFDLATVYRYLSEAYAGYHWNALHGINLDVGLFTSYVGLFSYDTFENWAYQPSFTSDNTPWFFNGARLQVLPTDRLKAELWLINGWQSYGKFNTWPGLGYQLAWRPTSCLALVSNGYLGTDTLLAPGRLRLHSDNSLSWRYHQRPAAWLSRAAVSLTVDVGGETGDGVSLTGAPDVPAQNFMSAMAYHRVWLRQNTLAWTLGGGFIRNPGRYLVLAPTGAAANAFSYAAGTSFSAWDVSTTFDWMPNQHSTWRLEVAHRQASDGYFAGRGGVTSPDGLSTTDADGWAADLARQETRLILAMIVRF